jgi:hypothetical protein
MSPAPLLDRPAGDGGPEALRIHELILEACAIVERLGTGEPPSEECSPTLACLRDELLALAAAVDHEIGDAASGVAAVIDEALERRFARAA